MRDVSSGSQPEGLAEVTSSATAGAHHAKVLSLFGAGAPSLMSAHSSGTARTDSGGLFCDAARARWHSSC